MEGAGMGWVGERVRVEDRAPVSWDCGN